MKRFFIGALLLMTNVFISNLVIAKILIVHPSKDDGFVLRILSLAINSALFFCITKVNAKLQLRILIGILIGLSGYLIVIILYISIDTIYPEESILAKYLTMNGDHYLAALIVLIIGILDHLLYRKEVIVKS